MNRKILIIDDDSNVRDVLAEFLEQSGYSVVQASNGTTVLPLVRAHHPDLIICDIVMPGISGLQVLKQVKAEFPNQTFLMMSGVQEEDTAREAMSLGAKDYLAKPVSLEQLEKCYLEPLFGKSDQT